MQCAVSEKEIFSTESGSTMIINSQRSITVNDASTYETFKHVQQLHETSIYCETHGVSYSSSLLTTNIRFLQNTCLNDVTSMFTTE